MISRNASDSSTLHERYKIDILSQDKVARTLGVAADRSHRKVIEVARQGLHSIPTATHAVIRALDGKELIIYASDNWWTCQVKAFKL